MKTITCYEDACDVAFQSDDRDEMLQKLYEHYMNVHPNIIPSATETEKKAWMEVFDRDWTAAGKM